MSNAFSFRLSQQETDWVLSQSLLGETQHQTLQRLVRERLIGSFTSQSVDNTVDKSVDNLKDQVKQELRAELIEVINKRLGELPA